MEEFKPKISIVLPCRNEEQALGYCLDQIKEVISKNNLSAEVIVSDSSSDRSPEIAREFEIKLIKHNKVGYGAAYLEGFKHAKGDFLFLADADGTYNFNEISRFIKYLEQDFDLVIGDRFKGKMDKEAMPWLNRYIGNPFLSFIFRLFFKSVISDVHCGMRAIKKESLDKINLRTTGMEFASEMVIKAVKYKFKIKELPIDYHKRKGDSKLKPLADGWRHLRFMLLYSPLFLFFIPGILLFLVGVFSLSLIYLDFLVLFGIKFQYHPMFLASLVTIIGYQLIIFSLFAKTYATTHLGENNIFFDKLYKYINIETGSLIGIILGLVGMIIYFLIFWNWFRSDFGAIQEVKNSILALTIIVLGIQTIFSSFMLSILGIKEK